MTPISGIFVKLVYQILAVVLILAGLVIFPLPIPFGAALIAVGLTVLIGNSQTFAAFLWARRVRHPRVHELLNTLEDRMPTGIRRILERSDPDVTEHPDKQAG